MNRTSCYAASCHQEFYYYIYARFLFNLIIVLIRLASILIFGYAKAKIFQSQQKKELNIFQEKLRNLIRLSIEEFKR